MARTVLTSAQARLEVALLTFVISRFAIGAVDIGRGISDIGLREASDKVMGSRVQLSSMLLEQVCSNALVVTSDQRVVAEHRSTVNREPGQDANILLVAVSTQLEKSQSLVDVVLVSLTLGFWIGLVGIRATVDVGVFDIG